MQQMQTHRYRKAHIPHALRRTVWNTYIGEDIGSTECYVGCKTKISQMTFECGHIEAESKGGLTIVENLRPICSSCNKSMGTRNMHDFMKTFGFKSDIIEENNNDDIVDIDIEDGIIDIDIEDENQNENENENENEYNIFNNIDYIHIAKEQKRVMTNPEPSPEASCRLVPSEPISYFIENCIKYKKGKHINFDDMYQLFNGFCPAFCDKEIVKSIDIGQFIDYFYINCYDVRENILYDYKFRYDIDDENDEIREINENKCEETFYDVVEYY